MSNHSRDVLGKFFVPEYSSPSQVGRLPPNKSRRQPFFPRSPGASFQKSVQDVNDCLPRVYPSIPRRCIAPMQGCVCVCVRPNHPINTPIGTGCVQAEDTFFCQEGTCWYGSPWTPKRGAVCSHNSLLDHFTHRYELI